jgi:flagellar protein FlbD
VRDRRPGSRDATEGNMITLHRLGHNTEQLHLNPDLITTVEANPDTVVTLTTGSKFLVSESPEDIAEAVREWRAGILDVAWRSRHAVPA